MDGAAPRGFGFNFGVTDPRGAASSQPSTDEEHIACLRGFYSEMKPDNVEKAERLFGFHGEHIWERLKELYPRDQVEKYKKVR
jgi:hypothetical protein